MISLCVCLCVWMVKGYCRSLQVVDVSLSMCGCVHSLMIPTDTIQIMFRQMPMSSWTQITLIASEICETHKNVNAWSSLSQYVWLLANKKPSSYSRDKCLKSSKKKSKISSKWLCRLCLKSKKSIEIQLTQSFSWVPISLASEALQLRSIGARNSGSSRRSVGSCATCCKSPVA